MNNVTTSVELAVWACIRSGDSTTQRHRHGCDRGARALAEAGNPTFQAAFCGTAYLRVASAQVAGRDRRTACRSSTSKPGAATAARVDARRGSDSPGQYECVLVFGIEKMPGGIIPLVFFDRGVEESGSRQAAYFRVRPTLIANRVSRKSISLRSS